MLDRDIGRIFYLNRMGDIALTDDERLACNIVLGALACGERPPSFARQEVEPLIWRFEKVSPSVVITTADEQAAWEAGFFLLPKRIHKSEATVILHGRVPLVRSASLDDGGKITWVRDGFEAVIGQPDPMVAAAAIVRALPEPIPQPARPEQVGTDDDWEWHKTKTRGLARLGAEFAERYAVASASARSRMNPKIRKAAKECAA